VCWERERTKDVCKRAKVQTKALEKLGAKLRHRQPGTAWDLVPTASGGLGQMLATEHSETILNASHSVLQLESESSW